MKRCPKILKTLAFISEVERAGMKTGKYVWCDSDRYLRIMTILTIEGTIMH